MKKDIHTLFEEHNGWLRSQDFAYRSDIYREINALVAQKKVKKIQNGLYYNASHESYNEWKLISLLYPKAIVCGLSALAYYELTTAISTAYHLAFPHKYKPKISEYPPIKAYYWTDKYFNLGISKLDEIQIYDIEKTICDAFRMHNIIGEDIVYESIKNYMNTEDRNIEKLITYAQIMRVDQKIEPLLKMLI